ncbi:DUF5753 domain-containing protein [Saccharopolyspora hirsuta]|uniref:DUF5753 domain-containing protein n=1 Tax=Saccharopolyspora hirsuta TaxID=1837 RepID=UPI001FE2F67B|nr:DUF5753 domain-containing protein [Saccharopolyspora hirsuta]
MAAAERDRILDLARNVHEPNWLTVGLNGIPQQLAGAVECERAATAIAEWAPMLVPGLLQTLDYNRSMKKASGLSEADTELRVMLSASRREVITRRSDPVSFNAFIGEAALFEPIGTAEVMVEQLDQLVEFASRDNIAVRMVPLRTGWHPGLLGPFVLYEFDDITPVVHFEHYSSGAFIPAEHDVDEYRSAIQQIESLAMDERTSVEFIVEAKATWER